MSLARHIGINLAATLAWLIAADLVGVAASFFFDAIASERYTSTALYYAIWFVTGVFCGMLIYATCGSFTPAKKDVLMTWEDQGQAGLSVILTMAATLAALSILFYRLGWRYPRADSVYVPDSESLTLTFFVAILGSAILFHTTMRPDMPAKPRSLAGRQARAPKTDSADSRSSGRGRR